MNQDITMTATPSRQQQVRRVLMTTLVLNFTVAVGKIVVGAASGALAISADGIHSLIDGVSNVIALLATRIADKPPDDEHPYGHRRFETLAALMLGALLLLTAWEIVGGALERLQTGETPVITPLTVAVLVATLVVNLFVSRYEQRAGRRLGSELLIADAANTGADVFVTLSVLVSTALVAVFDWMWADPLAALIIVVLIGRAAWQVLGKTGRVLVDTAPYTAGRLTALVEEVPSVRHVSRARSRGTVDAAHIDIDVRVAPEMTADHTAAIADAIRAKLAEHLSGIAEVEVHFAPDYANAPDYALTARARADALGLATHEVRVSEGPDGKVMELHVEVPPGQTLADAHAQVTVLEQRVRQSLPDLADVITHIEPAMTHRGDGDGDTAAAAKAIECKALALLREYAPESHWHHVRVTRYDGGFALAIHMTLPPTTTVEAAHDRAEAAEILLRNEISELQRATIHTEPPPE